MAAWLMATVAIIAAMPASAQSIDWRSPAVPDREPPGVMTSLEAAAAIRVLVEDPATNHVVIQLNRPLDDAGREALRASGLAVQAPLGANAFTARLVAASFDEDRLAATGLLQRAGPLEAPRKLHRDFVSGDFEDLPPWGRAVISVHELAAPIEVAAAYVLFHRDVSLDEAAQIVARHGGVVVSTIRTMNGLVVELPLASVAALARDDAVLWLEPPLPPLAGVNDSNRTAVQAEEVQAAPYGLDGAGVTVLVFDSGEALAAHADFGGRLTVHDNSGVSNHSTHVAGTIGGDGTMGEGQFRGMAPGVTLLSYGFEQVGGLQPGFLYSNPGDLEDDYQDAINNFGAVLSNNSLGTNTASNGFPCAWEGDYGVTSALIDAIVRGDLGAPMRIIWANGNERAGAAACGSTYNTTAPPANAKNHLAVGAVNSDDGTVTDFTSWGPSDDGRVRPDVCAPGCQASGDWGVTSCASNGGYTTMCGTSMACPTVTGCAALLIQDFRDQFPNRVDPLPSTLKALFIHTAQDIANPGPDYQSGYGLIQVRDAIDFMRTGNFLEGAAAQGDVLTFGLDVPVAAGVGPLRVTLAWDDAPGTPLVNPALVNDLDLIVTGPTGDHYPWSLNPQFPALPAVRVGPDHVNNVEQVVIDLALPGLYQIEVRGFNVPEGPQRFSLTASPALVHTSIRLVGPAPTVVAPGEAMVIAASIIAANDTIVPGSPTLHYRFDDGPFLELPLASDVDDLYTGLLPAAMCDDAPQFYLSAAGLLSGLAVDPPGAPGTVYAATVGTMGEVLHDDFEADLGWQVVNSPGLGDGAWQRGVPIGGGDRGDPPTDADGSGQCYLTSNLDGNSDVDDGSTALLSPVLDATGGVPFVSYFRWYSNVEGSNAHEDIFEVDVSHDGGASWINLETVGPAGPGVAGGWVHVERNLMTLPGFVATDQFQIRFTASDFGSGSVVEAGVDGVRLAVWSCTDTAPACPADVSTPADGMVDIVDLLLVLAAWESSDPDFDIAPAGGDGIVNVLDLLLLLSEWGPCP